MNKIFSLAFILTWRKKQLRETACSNSLHINLHAFTEALAAINFFECVTLIGTLSRARQRKMEWARVMDQNINNSFLNVMVMTSRSPGMKSSTTSLEHE